MKVTMRLLCVTVFILCFQFTTLAYEQEGITVNKQKVFGVWNVQTVESDNSNRKFVSMQTQFSPLSIFQIGFYQGNNGQLTYRIYNPNLQYLSHGASETIRYTIKIGTLTTQVMAIVNVNQDMVATEFYMPSNFVNLAKNNNLLTIISPNKNIPPVTIQLNGFAEAYKYATKLFKSIK